MEIMMDFFECIENRKSCRAFIEKKVEKSVLEKILTSANRSPSYMNSQPWQLFVAAGKKKDALAKKLFETASSSSDYKPDFPFPKEWPEAIESRINKHKLARLAALGIAPDDKERIAESYMRNFRFFNAPCVIFIGVENSLTSWSVFDLGLFVHGLLLALEAQGLASCPQALTTAYADTIRTELDIPENISVALSVSIGHPDINASVNQYYSSRRDIEQFVQWYSFKD